VIAVGTVTGYSKNLFTFWNPAVGKKPFPQEANCLFCTPEYMAARGFIERTAFFYFSSLQTQIK